MPLPAQVSGLFGIRDLGTLTFGVTAQNQGILFAPAP